MHPGGLHLGGLYLEAPVPGGCVDPQSRKVGGMHPTGMLSCSCSIFATDEKA